MKRLSFVAGAAFSLMIALSGCGLKKDTKAAEAEVDRFHQHWNADEFKAIYDEAHEHFRNKSAEETVGTFARVKGVWGQFKSATKRSWGFNTNNGMTDVKLKYDSTYERTVEGKVANGTAVEAFVYRMTGGKAMLTSYEIMSPEAAKQHEAEEQAERDAKSKKNTKKPNG